MFKKEILLENCDEKLFYLIVLAVVFKEFKRFEIRKDIPIPDDNGVVLVFDEGNIAYFKILDKDLTSKEIDFIFKSCLFLRDEFGGFVEAFVLCCPDIELKTKQILIRDNILIRCESLKSFDGEGIVEKLQLKFNSNEKFNLKDYVFHILLPYLGYQNKDDFLLKYQNYITSIRRENVECFDSCNLSLD